MTLDLHCLDDEFAPTPQAAECSVHVGLKGNTFHPKPSSPATDWGGLRGC